MNTLRITETGGTTEPRSRAVWAFIVGTSITLPATLWAVLYQSGEALHPFLVPSTLLLRPVADNMASWPGIDNVAVAAVVNGIVYACGFFLLSRLAERSRAR